MSAEDGAQRARVLAIVHQSDAGPGVFGEAIRNWGAELDEWLIPGGDRPPRDLRDYAAVLSLGGAMHVDQTHAHPWLDQERALLSGLLEATVPVLGVCLGAQLLAQAAGGAARRARPPEIGWYDVQLSAEGSADPVFGPLAPGFQAFGWHSYEVVLPEEASVLARGATCVQAYRLADRAWGIQFHAEVTRRDVLTWIEDYHSDPDAVAIGVDPAALRERTERSIAAWNELGRGLCERFIAQATELPSVRAVGACGAA